MNGLTFLGFVLILVLTSKVADCFSPPQNPQWAPTYNMSMSTITMSMNSNGWSDPHFDSRFGIVSYDWSNAKVFWAAANPMDCEERLVEQSLMTSALNPDTHIFVYRNLIKALPWYSSVRSKLSDPQYSGWFLSFDSTRYPNHLHVPPCDDNYSPPLCSRYYHDQEQTPEVPTPSDPNPDGKCVGQCHCGGVPCGEYLFDHRNDSLREWLIQEYILGPTAIGNPHIHGLFLDDFWCSNKLNGTCGDPVQGPSEIDANSAIDMGLTDSNIYDLTLGWLQTMNQVESALIENQAYTWWFFPNQYNANASPTTIAQYSCIDLIRESCTSDLYVNTPLLMGLVANASNAFIQVTEDVAAFLLMRGPYAYIGYGQWGMVWPIGIPRPIEIDTDYGEPVDAKCSESSNGVFERKWTKADVTLDCNAFVGKIVLH